MTETSRPVVLLTGSVGKIGSRLVAPLKERYRLRCTDIRIPEHDEGVDFTLVDLSDPTATDALMEGVDHVVHMAGIPREADIAEIAPPNLVATHNLYASAHRHGVRRIIFGSTNHTVGFYPAGEIIDENAAVRPDTLYGASKVFGEAVARLFHDKHGLESVCLRIGSALDRPMNARQLCTWVSYRDLGRLVCCALDAPEVGFEIIYGRSASSTSWWRDSGSERIGYQPADNADDYREEVGAAPGDPDDPAVRFQGGPWAADGYDR